jgi:hypothetical protein
MRSPFPTFRAVLAWLGAGRLHGVNAVVTIGWSAYFDASVSSPFGTKTLPMVLVAPVLIGLCSGLPLPRHDSGLTRQTVALSSGRIALTRLAVSASLFAVGGGAWVAATGTMRGLGPALWAYALVIISASVLGQLFWLPVALGFVALLPWLLTDAGMTAAFAVGWSDAAAPVGVVGCGAAACLYLQLDRHPMRLRRPLLAE